MSSVRLVKRSGVVVMLVTIVAGLLFCTGADCDSDAAATFRETATGPIGEGVKTIVDGVLDGMIATIQDAGDGSATTSTTSKK